MQDLRREVARTAGQTGELRIGDELDVQVPARLDQLG